MDSSQDFKSLQDKIQTALVATTRTSNQIAAEDLSFQRSSNPTVDEQLDETSERFLVLASSLLKSATKGTDIKAPELEDADDVDVHWSRIVDVIDDALLDKANICLDEYTGLVKRKAAPSEEQGPQPKKPKTFTALDNSMRRANILKPQNAFELKPENLDTSPWKPILTSKPHAKVPLEKSLGTFNNQDHSVQYKHPYETEILQLEHPLFVFETKEPIRYQPVENTAATFVNTFEGVLDMLAELKKAKEIAIDTEHHDYRTYSGLLSLMQISTRDKDWIVDTLQPWRHKLEVLNEVFADPRIIKVLHGAYMDIIWLQRDCGLYIVGLFDTYEACVSLGYSARSLAYLLKRFVDFDADKKYQLADWRIRPIPEEMFYYARSDTHYLLYIYDMLRNELLSRSNRSNPDQDYIGQVLERSKETSLRRYEKSPYDAEGGQGAFGWLNMLLKQSAGTFSREQFAIFRAVHQWRDEMARRIDESPVFVITNPAVFDIARRLPHDGIALHSILSGTSSNVPKQSLDELFKVLEKAKIDGANGPTVSEFLRTSNNGVGAVAQQVFPHLKAGNTENIADTKELIAESSQLWGNMPLSTRWDNPAHVNGTNKGMQFALPWASFVENASVSESKSEQATVEPKAPTGPLTNGEEEANDAEFTLKSGLKRKAPPPESDDESDEEGQVTSSSAAEPRSVARSDDEISVRSSTDEDEREKRRKAKKKEKKVLKKAKKLADKEKRDAAVENEQETEESFDYSKAQSVIKAPSNRDREKKGGKAKVFSPYASQLTAEGPKSARRMHGEKPGKSATFRKI